MFVCACVSKKLCDEKPAGVCLQEELNWNLEECVGQSLCGADGNPDTQTIVKGLIVPMLPLCSSIPPPLFPRNTHLCASLHSPGSLELRRIRFCSSKTRIRSIRDSTCAPAGLSSCTDAEELGGSGLRLGAAAPR